MSPNDMMMSVRIPLGLARWIQGRAAKQNVSTSAFVRGVLEVERQTTEQVLVDYAKELVEEAVYFRRGVESRFEVYDDVERVVVTVLNYVPGRHIDWAFNRGVLEDRVRGDDKQRRDVISMLRSHVFGERADQEIAYLASDSENAVKFRATSGEKKLAPDILEHTPFAEEARANNLPSDPNLDEWMGVTEEEKARVRKSKSEFGASKVKVP